MFELLRNFTELEELNLHGNPVCELPENIKDLSPNISSIDMGEIAFEDVSIAAFDQMKFEDTIEKLQSFPQLKTVNILLTEESQVDLVMSSLFYL